MQNLYFSKTYWNNRLSPEIIDYPVQNLLFRKPTGIIDYPWQLKHKDSVFNLNFENLLE